MTISAGTLSVAADSNLGNGGHRFVGREGPFGQPQQRHARSAILPMHFRGHKPLRVPERIQDAHQRRALAGPVEDDRV